MRMEVEDLQLWTMGYRQWTIKTKKPDMDIHIWLYVLNLRK